MNESSQNLPLRKGMNYAPLKPLLAIRDKQEKGVSHYLADALKERYTHFMDDNKDVWQDLISVGHLTSLFIQGKQNLRWNSMTKNFYAVPVHQQAGQSRKDNIRVTPIMRFYETNCESRYMSSNPDVTVIAGRDDDKCQQAAQGAKVIVDYYERQKYTNWFNRNEALNLMSFGTQINRIKWNSALDGWKAVRKIFSDVEFPISNGVGQCFDCGHSGDGTQYRGQSDTFPSCPNCDSFNVYHEPPATQIIPVQTGSEKVNLGDIEFQGLEFPACRWNLRYKAEESSHFIYEQMTSLGAVQRLFGNVNIPEDKIGKNDFGLQIVESLANAGLAINGKSQVREVQSALYKEQVKVTEMYLSPDDCAGIKCKGDEQTVGGQTLPKDVNLADLFPNGLVAVGLNGMNVLLGVYAESHKDQLTTGVWHQRQFSGAGQGVSDTVELQKRFNETDSQGYLAMKHNATPATIYADGAIDAEYVKYLGKPDVAIPINISGFPNLRSLDQILSSPRIGTIDSALLSYYSQNLQNMMQLTMNVTEFSGGLPGVNNKTATGAQITDANAASIFTPILQIKVDVRVRAAKIFVTLYRENVPVAQFFPLKSKYGAQQGVYLSGADLDKDLAFETTKNSELPKNRYSIRADISEFFMNVGGAPGFLQLKQADPEFADELIKIYDLELETDKFDEAAQICRQRLENAKKLLKQFGQIQQAIESQMMPQDSMPQTQPQSSEIPMTNNNGVYEPDYSQGTGLPSESAGPPPTPQPSQPSVQPVQQSQAMQPVQQPPQQPVDPNQQLAQVVIQGLTPPISVYEKNHATKAEWFQNFLDTDEGRNMDAQTRAVVYAIIEAHFTAGSQQAAVMAQMQGNIQVAANAPQAAAQNAQNQQSDAQSHRQNLQSNFQQHRQNLENQTVQNHQQMQSEGVKHNQNMELERLRQQGKGK